jgi:hypothetical protein
MPTPFTAKQGQYLAFIYYYTKIHGVPPAEADFRRFLPVTPPVVHQNVPKFAAEIRQIFTDDELQAYFASATRIGVNGHVCTEAQYETMRDAGAFDDDVVTGATDRRDPV